MQLLLFVSELYMTGVCTRVPSEEVDCMTKFGFWPVLLAVSGHSLELAMSYSFMSSLAIRRQHAAAEWTLPE